ncbi:MAG: hypothetical protein AABZ60_24175 [Planctomycetota bacterium]
MRTTLLSVLFIIVLFSFKFGASFADNPETLNSIPLGKGLPVVVRVGIFFVNIPVVNENEGDFSTTIDLRLIWEDPRLRFPLNEIPNGSKVYRGKDAELRLSELWSPEIKLANMIEETSSREIGLRNFPNGSLELTQRITGRFSIQFQVQNYPFDRQKLEIELLSNRDTQEWVTLTFLQKDLEFSRVSPQIELDDWDLGIVDLERAPLIGWYGKVHSRILASLLIIRRPINSLPAIFIPLFASLLIPLLALWLNKIEDGEFQIGALDIANVIIGGLFAIIALNFAVNSEYKILASNDNTVTRLFGLNYLVLALSLGIDIFIFRFNFPKRFFGRYVQEEFFRYLCWAIPLLSFVTATAILLVAIN